MVVLVVDDDPIIALAVADELEAAGHRVLGPAHDSRAAMDLVKADPPDVALVDIDLGQGGDGVALARDLRRAGVTAIFASGECERARAHSDVAVACLAKPYAPEAAVRSVEAIQAALKGLRPNCPPELEWYAVRSRRNDGAH